ncbi:MAG: D-alanyl-lipoteichoic acid biosynthesis protein DltD [Candidatus Udaeobacter sp.]
MRPARTATPHLLSGFIAVGFAATILFAGRITAIHLEREALHTVAPSAFELKNQGLAFQRAAAHARDVLPIYGSSELVAPVQERAGVFFRNAPTGFQASPVGKAGTTPLIMLQDLAALGPDLHGKKIAISLSAVWFLVPDITTYSYESNFSLFAASALVFSDALDFELKRDIASRMLQFPGALKKSPLLGFALRRLAAGGSLDRVIFYALWPLGKVQNALIDLQDHLAALSYILYQENSRASLHQQTLDWPSLLAKASETADVSEKRISFPVTDQQTAARRSDAWFVDRLNRSNHWKDLELLLRVMTEIHARPLLLSMPMDGRFYDESGISRPVRECYYRKMRELVQQYHFALAEFEQHDEDPIFLNRRAAQVRHIAAPHLTAKGWMFYDRVLDNFYHGRVPRG